MRHVAPGSSLFAALLSCLTLTLALPAAAAAAFADQRPVTFESSSLREAARSLPPAGGLRVVAVPLAEGGKDRLRDLTLERFEVFAPQSRIVLHTDAGEVELPRPADIYLRGKIEGDPRSRAVISVLESGEIRGVVTSTGHYWLVGAAPESSLLAARELTAAELASQAGGFRCETEGALPGGDAQAAAAEALAAQMAPGPLAASIEQVVQGIGFDHTVVLAIETDNEFLARFSGNTLQATTYIGNLVAFASSIYIDEVQTSWLLGPVSLWQSTDPFGQGNSGCGLLEFGRYWNLNHTGTVRTTAHFLSGKSFNSGVAWVGVLCSGPFNAVTAQLSPTGCAAPVNAANGTWGGAYAFTSSIIGNFNIGNPNVVWDIVAFAHETGHNFGSGHTHCYAGVLGSEHIDKCVSHGPTPVSGCNSTPNAASLPQGCPGTGQGCGTIMSYCHQYPGGGGYGNMTMTLGEGHPYGVTPSRVPTVMRNHVVARAGQFPTCLAPITAGTIFEDGFETHNTSRWSQTLP